MKPIDVERVEPRNCIELSKKEVLETLLQHLSDNDVRLGGRCISSYGTEAGGYYIILEEEKNFV